MMDGKLTQNKKYCKHFFFQVELLENRRDFLTAKYAKLREKLFIDLRFIG